MTEQPHPRHFSVSRSVLQRAAGSARPSMRQAPLESLEARRLLASIEGNIWNDIDNDGLKDFFETGLAGVTVYIDENGSAQFEPGETYTITNSRGNYRFDNLSVAPPVEDDPLTPDDETAPGGSTYYVRHLPSVDGVDLPLAQTTPGIAGRTNVQSNFDIEIVYADANLSDDQKTIIETAINVWERAIIGDLPDVGEIDDIQITVFAQQVDGPGGILAFARPTEFRPPGAIPLADFADTPRGLPFRGEITVDISDSLPSRGFVETVAHEIGHVMGIGSLWNPFLVNRNTPSVAYTGENAVRELNRLFDGNFSGVPVQPNVEGHWDEFGLNGALGRELMSPFADGGFELPPDADPVEPFSRLTIGALQDFGYEVNFAAAEPFGPFNIGPLPEDLNPDLGFVPFAIGAFLESADSIVDDANFGVRPNTNPNPFFLTAGPVIQQVGQPVRLLAELDTTTEEEFNGDVDFRDSLVQINFYRESNGVPGLQTGEGGDTIIDEDADRTDGFEVSAETTGLDLGEVIFYARGYDQGYFTVDRALVVNLVDGQTIPAAPSHIQSIGTDERTILLNWLDNSDDENGFLLQVSRSPDFDITADITSIYLPAQAGTGPYTYTYDAFEGALTTRYFRVRSFTTAGSSPFGGRTGARTLSRDEVLLDDQSPDVEVSGDFQQVIDSQRAVNLTYLQGTSGSVEMAPGLRQQSGEYFVFYNRVATDEAGVATVSLLDENGNLIDEVDVDMQEIEGGDVLLGRFRLNTGSFIRVEPRSGVVRVDTIRFLPVG